MGAPRSQSSAARLREADKRDDLVRRVLAGMTVRAAAASLEINEKTAQSWYVDALRQAYDDGKGNREEALGRELATLDLLQRALMPQALRGHVRSAEVVLSVMDRRSKYLGLDEATRVRVEYDAVENALAEVVQVLEGEIVAQVEPLRMIG
jgi:hypothetical protein